MNVRNRNNVPWQETVSSQRLLAESDRALSKISVHFIEGMKKWGGDITVLDLVTPRKCSHVKELNYTNIVNSNQLRHYATCRKVGGWIPDEIIGFFN
jgi:hypothetical protein